MVETSSLLLAAGTLGGAYYISQSSGGGQQQPQLPQLPGGGPGIELDLSGLTPDATGPAIDLGLGGLGEAFESQSNAIRTLVEERGGGRQGADIPWERILDQQGPDIPWDRILDPNVPGPGSGPGPSGEGDGSSGTPSFFEGLFGFAAPDPGGYAREQATDIGSAPIDFIFSGSDAVKDRGLENVVRETAWKYSTPNLVGNAIDTARENQVVNLRDVDPGTAANLATPFNTGGLPDVDLPDELSPVGTAAAEPDPEPSISVLDRSQSPQAGTPSPAELEAVASGARERVEEEVEKVTQRSGSTGATLVK